MLSQSKPLLSHDQNNMDGEETLSLFSDVYNKGDQACSPQYA